MTIQTQRILDKALALPRDERVEMARALLLSANSPAGEDDATPADGVSFSERWRGKFEPAERDETSLQGAYPNLEPDHPLDEVKEPSPEYDRDPPMPQIQAPPKMVYDNGGDLVEVILSADDFRTYLRTLNTEADWESLPRHLQDAVDRLLIDEVRGEKDQALALDAVLAGTSGT